MQAVKVVFALTLNLSMNYMDRLKMRTKSSEFANLIIWLQASLNHHITNYKEGDLLTQTHTDIVMTY